MNFHSDFNINVILYIEHSPSKTYKWRLAKVNDRNIEGMLTSDKSLRATSETLEELKSNAATGFRSIDCIACEYNCGICSTNFTGGCMRSAVSSFVVLVTFIKFALTRTWWNYQRVNERSNSCGGEERE